MGDGPPLIQKKNKGEFDPITLKINMSSTTTLSPKRREGIEKKRV
jgi:hypothetical protein